MTTRPTRAPVDLLHSVPTGTPGPPDTAGRNQRRASASLPLQSRHASPLPSVYHCHQPLHTHTHTHTRTHTQPHALPSTARHGSRDLRCNGHERRLAPGRQVGRRPPLPGGRHHPPCPLLLRAQARRRVSRARSAAPQETREKEKEREREMCVRGRVTGFLASPPFSFRSVERALLWMGCAVYRVWATHPPLCTLICARRDRRVRTAAPPAALVVCCLLHAAPLFSAPFSGLVAAREAQHGRPPPL